MTLAIGLLWNYDTHQIRNLVYGSHQVRQKAKELLEKAKREVEEFIEKK
jgi:hypothetical protein